MPDQADLTEKPQTQSTPTASPPANKSELEKTIHLAIGICSMALIGCFFLPWIKIFFGNLSGYQLQQLPSDEAKLVWFIPGGGVLALLTVLARQGVVPATQIAGALPFIALIYYRIKIGEGFFQALQPGAYITLFIAAILSALPRFLKKPQS